MGAWERYATSFLTAGFVLRKSADEFATRAATGWVQVGLGEPTDDVVIPALYQIRHGPELLLEPVAACQNVATESDDRIERTHGLSALHNRVKPFVSIRSANRVADRS